MDKNHFISRAKELMAEDLNDESVTYYLKQEGASPDSIPAIIETARLEFADEQAKKITKQNKLFYYVWVSLALAVFVFMLFVLPYWQIVLNRVFIFSLGGSVICSVLILIAFSHYKTWNENYVRRIGKARIRYPFIAVLWIPVFILHLIFSARISASQESELKQTQVEVTGHVIGGSSTQVKKLIGGTPVTDLSTIVVEFETKEGKKTIVSKTVDASEFKDFYKGEEVHIIYSKTNPHNIDLLDNANSVRNFKGSEERDLEPADLMRLVAASPENLDSELNKISYGWAYNSEKGAWINNKRECAIALKGNELNFVGKEDYNTTIPTYLTQNGFKLINKEDPTDLFHTGKKIFESKQFIFNVEVRGMPDSAHAVIAVMKK